MRAFFLPLALLPLALLALAAPAAAQSGALDPSFGTDGIVRFEAPERETLTGLVLLDDGRILLSARSDQDSFVARLLGSGQPDPAFGTDGVVRFGTRLGALAGVAVLPDGRFYVAGRTDPPTDFVLRRFLADGQLDPTFGAGGVVTSDVGGTPDYAYDMALQAGGRIVMVGASIREAGSFDTDLALVRYTADGSLDDTFGTDGQAFLDLGPEAYGYTVVAQPDGRLLVTGKLGGQFPSDLFVARLQPDGSLDSGFGVDGVTTLDFREQDYGSGLAVLPDGRIVVTGSSGFEEFQDLARVRLLPDGSPDPAFENDVLFLNGRNNSGADVAALPDGFLLVAGRRYVGPDNLLRLRPDGSIDTSFGTDGVVQGTLGEDASAAAVRMQPDGKAVMGGWAGFPENVAVARLLNVLPVGTDGAPGSRFAVQASPNPASGRTALTVSTPTVGVLRLTVVDALGRRVRVLHDGPLAAGEHRFVLDAAGLAPGVYVVRAQAGGEVATRRVVLR